MQFSVRYILLFSIAVCGVCAVFVSSLAVSLKDRQETNEKLFKQRNVLEAAGLIETGQAVTPEEINNYFQNIEAVLVDLQSGQEVEAEDAAAYDQQAAKKDPELGRDAPKNPSLVFRLPLKAQVFKVKDDSGAVDMYVLPIEGYGLWGTLFGFIALDSDTNTVQGLTYYQHKETPGLGGEVDNPNWKALWEGRKVYDNKWQPSIQVIKGQAGPAGEDPYRVDGLSGATITARGVENMLDFWLGPEGFGPYLENVRNDSVANDSLKGAA